jgi:group I intron endonuclease
MGRADLWYNTKKKWLRGASTPKPLLLIRSNSMSSSIPHSSGIYCIKCIPAQKCYIGSSSDLHNRQRDHYAKLRIGKHRNPHLQSAFKKHGEHAFIFEVLELCDKSALIEREQYYLDTLQPFAPNGFNIALHAHTPTHTPEVCQRISKSHKGIKPDDNARAKMRIAKLGKQRSSHSQETKDKIGVGNKDKVRSPELRAHLSIKLKGRPGTMTGKHLSQEQRAKVSESGKKDYIITAPDGTVYHVHGLVDFCMAHHLHPGHMASVAAGKRNAHKRWKCQYRNEGD